VLSGANDRSEPTLGLILIRGGHRTKTLFLSQHDYILTSRIPSSLPPAIRTNDQAAPMVNASADNELTGARARSDSQAICAAATRELAR
jgi:hypothetical protein